MTARLRQHVLRSSSTSEGFSLIELLVTLALLSVLLAVFGAGLSIMFKDVRHQLGQSDGLDASRKVLDQLDKQVRYANAVDTPGTTTGASGGVTWWVEWQSGDVGQQQSCTQWRLLPTGEMQYRTWLQPAPSAGSAAISGQTAWSTRATRVALPAGAAAGTTGPVFAFPAPADRANARRQQLVVAFTSSYGRPVVTTPSQVTLTAQNTSSSSPLLSAVCGGQRT